MKRQREDKVVGRLILSHYDKDEKSLEIISQETVHPAFDLCGHSIPSENESEVIFRIINHASGTLEEISMDAQTLIIFQGRATSMLEAPYPFLRSMPVVDDMTP